MALSFKYSVASTLFVLTHYSMPRTLIRSVQSLLCSVDLFHWNQAQSTSFLHCIFQYSLYHGAWWNFPNRKSLSSLTITQRRFIVRVLKREPLFRMIQSLPALRNLISSYCMLPAFSGMEPKPFDSNLIKMVVNNILGHHPTIVFTSKNCNQNKAANKTAILQT